MESKYKMTKKDIILLLVFGILVVISLGNYIMSNGLDNVGGMIEQTILIMLAFVTLADVSSYMNWIPFVPDFFEYAKEKKYKKEVEEHIQILIHEDAIFLENYRHEQIGFIISQLGISVDQFDKIRLELIRMRCIPLKEITDAQEKIKKLVVSDYPIVIDQKKINSTKICYKKVRYYINITDIMFFPEYAGEISALLAFLITEKVHDLSLIDKLVVPYDSNFLLAVEVSKKLGKPLIKMRDKNGKIEIEKRWDGNLDLSDRIIIIHDVLVTGDQIIDTINKLPNSCTIEGFFCIIVRKEFAGKKVIEQKSITCNQIIELDDNDIEKLRRENEN